MSGLIPIPNTRVSGLLSQQRLLGQLQADQLALFRLQDQVSTGRRINLPSEDAASALRALTLQRLLERKGQIATNLESGQSFLAATDAALNDVAALLGDIRGEALGVADTISTQEQRDALAIEVNRTIEQLVRIGNQQFRGRYLFAGSQTNVRPYEFDGEYVSYEGNEQEIRNYSDIDVLFATNAVGNDVFGGLSSDVLGTADLNPQLTASTPLSSLRAGAGVTPGGALAISDGVETSIVSLDGASDIGDVVRAIESNPPAGRQITVSITGQGLTLELDALGGGNLTVAEVAGGSSARQLGILEEGGVLTAPLVGEDLDPAVSKTTRVNDLLGAKATARLVSAGDNNDLLIAAAVNGPEYNGAAIQIVDHDLLTAAPGIARGSEYAEYDAAARTAVASLAFSGVGNDLTIAGATPGAALNDVKIFVAGQTGLGNAALANYDAVNKRLVLTVDNGGATTVGEVVNAVNGTGVFTAVHDNSVEATYNPAALIDGADVANVQGDTGQSGGDANTLYVYVKQGESKANDAVAAINAEGTFTAAIDPLDTDLLAQAGNGVISTTSSATAAGGSGAPFDQSGGIQVVNGGQLHILDFNDVATVEDILNVFNGSDAGLLAEINADGTGINVRSRLSGADLQIAENGGQTASQLGLQTLTAETKLGQLNYGIGVETRTGDDLTITSQDGAGVDQTFSVDLSSATTIGDVLDAINSHPNNNTGGVAVLARMKSVGNGIELVDANPTGTGELTVAAESASYAGNQLGVIPDDQSQVTSPSGVITGEDRYFLDTSSVFSTLIRLRDALSANDIGAMERAISQIDGDLSRATTARSDVGARQRALDLTQQGLADEDVQLQSALSTEIDVDLVEAISNLTARQVSLQASLQTSAALLRTSLLDYL